MNSGFVVGGAIVLAVVLGVLVAPWAGAGALLALNVVWMGEIAGSRSRVSNVLLGVLQKRRLAREERKPRVSRAF